MKILMVAPRFSPKSGGGGYVITNNLLKELIKRDNEVELWTSDYGIAINYLLKDSPVDVIPFHTLVTLMGFHITPLLSRYANLSFRMENWEMDILDSIHIVHKQFDVIHLQGCRTFQNIVVSHYARKYKIPYIVDAHGFPIQGSWLHKLVLKTFDLLFANKIVRGAKYCIAETEVGKQEYLRAGVKEERIKIIPCPYDLSIFDNLPEKGEFREKYKILSRYKIIGFLGGLDRIKGLDFLVEAFAKLREGRERDDLVLVLAGTDMGFKKELDVQIERLSIKDRVIFTGYISGRDKLEYLVDREVCVFPSRAEQGLPFAALEAIMCGVPIIVSDGTGATEDVRVMKGGIISDSDANNISFNINNLLSNDDLRSYLVKNGQEWIRKNLSLEEKVKDYERVYEDVKGSYYSICR
jgi:glycosyltransferase involved in cell wall biosynthesis